MHLNLLHLDDALKSQRAFLRACSMLNARETNVQKTAAKVRLWGKDKHLADLRRDIAASLAGSQGDDTVVTFMGSGDFHHVSALLISLLADNAEQPITVIHFDNHPDWVKFKNGMHCGSWVNRALNIPQVAKIITIGVCSNDLKWPEYKGANLQNWRDEKIVLLPWKSPGKQFSEHDIGHMDENAFLEKLDGLITTRNVYITVDKDVLTHADAITNWDQGRMPLPRLIAILQSILAQHHAIGIDINGDYSPKNYKGDIYHVALKKLESLIDQPWRAPDLEKAALINEATNLALLNCIKEAV